MGSARRPFFTADDEDENSGTLSLEPMEAGFSGNGSFIQGQSFSLDDHRNRFSSKPTAVGSLRNIPYMGSPLNSPRFEDHHYMPRHFLDSCALCKKPLGSNRDIFMYRGDTAFCSEECRQEQMEMDEAREKNRSMSSLMKGQRKKLTTSPSKSDGRHLRTGTVTAG